MEQIITEEIAAMRSALLRDLVSSSPLLTEIAQFYAKRPSKYLRPKLVFLTALAINGLGDEKPTDTTSGNSATSSCLTNCVDTRQNRLAEIFEILHVASLLHDDVLDSATLRRGELSAPSVFGNKKTILAGDYLLGRAMSLSASLENTEVASHVASVVSTLVEGELVQLETATTPFDLCTRAELWDSYLQKTYMKTASLFKKALTATALLSSASKNQAYVDAVSTYGDAAGMAFQIMDDVMDYDHSVQDAGKPTGADLGLGLLTAPILYAIEDNAELLSIVSKGIQTPEDVAEAIRLVQSTNALSRTMDLAEEYAVKARDALSVLPDSPAKEALLGLSYQITRKSKAPATA